MLFNHILLIYACLQFFVASTVYYIASTLFPAEETFIPKAVLPDDIQAVHAHERYSEDLEKASLDKVAVRTEVKGTLSKHEA